MRSQSSDPIRPAAVAGTWYPGAAAPLRAEVDAHLGGAEATPAGDVVALIAPHAGLVYSGPVAAHSYRAVAGRRYDVVLLAGPSHYHGFEGVAIWPAGAFETPLGRVAIEAAVADRLLASPVVGTHPAAHDREHALEMQLPFLQAVLPGVPIVPLLLGCQERATIEALADALVEACAGRTPLLVASTDLSHYFPADRAAALDQVVVDHVDRFDVGGLLAEYERYPLNERGRYVACGGGAAIAVMRAAARLGAGRARVLRYADSGDVSGDKSAVVGYLAAVFERGDGAAPAARGPSGSS
jgi:AmmeMemoRadiSam system protein B